MFRLAPTFLLAAALLPQGKWQEIGRTSTGNAVFLDPRSVRKGGDGVITASIRATYTPPLDTPLVAKPGFAPRSPAPSPTSR